MTTTSAVPVLGAGAGRGRELRDAAVAAGGALALMTVAAPVAVFGLLPAGRDGAAALLLLGVVVLDVVVAVALVRVLGGGLLARTAGALRLVYSAAFAVAVAQLLGPGGEDAFTRLWDASLLVFGLHLVAVGVALWRMPRRPRLVATLVSLAGVAYLTDSSLTALAPAWAEATSGVTSACAMGELALAVWLLARAGRRA